MFKKQPMIPFNKPFISGNEIEYIQDALERKHISGDGFYTKKCHNFFKRKYGFKHTLLTTSCTDALEMASILIDIQPGDEVIIPSYTFVSTANAFVLRGAKIRFIDSYADYPNINYTLIESAITNKTKAIVLVHYGGVACAMDEIIQLAKKYNLFVVEDAAQAIDSFYKGKPLGSFGHLATFSFHETKNIISGEGGLLVINDEKLVERAEIIREKGTNRSKFFRGEINKYGWVDIGSSFLPSDMIAAFLYGQLENLESIQNRRVELWNNYFERLKELSEAGNFKLIPRSKVEGNNGHLFYLLCASLKERDDLIAYLKAHNILAVFHYQSLHKSDYFKDAYDGPVLENADKYTDCLVRLPIYCGLTDSEQNFIIEAIKSFYEQD